MIIPWLKLSVPVSCEDTPAALADGELEFGAELTLEHAVARSLRFRNRSVRTYAVCCDIGGFAVHSWSSSNDVAEAFGIGAARVRAVACFWSSWDKPSRRDKGRIGT